MYLSCACAALAGLASLAAAAPAPVIFEEPAPVEVEKRDIIIPIVQQIQETNIVVVEQNLDVISELVQVAEQQFAARIQAEFALIAQAETIKNNIRVNHFRSLFSTVNTVIVSVTNVLDVRNETNVNNRYFINQLLADNGVAESQIVVMVTAAETMTIGATPTNAAEIDNIIEGIAASETGVPSVKAYDASFPFGQIGQSVLLPFGTEAPTSELTFTDPAAIILEGQNLFIQNSQSFASDCSIFVSQGNTFINSLFSVFTSFQQIAAQQALGLVLGSGLGGNLFITTSTESATATATEEAKSTATEEATTTAEETAAAEETTAAAEETTATAEETTATEEATTTAEEATATATDEATSTSMEEAAETGEKDKEQMKSKGDMKNKGEKKGKMD